MPTGYGTDDGFASYMSDRGVTAPSGDVASARVRGSMALDQMYYLRWPGLKVSPVQERAWPRTDAFWADGTTPVDGIPDVVVWASYEAAYLELRSPGSMSPVVTPGKIKQRARVEGAVDVSYAQGSDPVQDQTPVAQVIEGLLFDLVGRRVPLPGVLVV